jgi:putative two-component system response regulator
MKDDKSVILVVDDIPDNLVLASALLKRDYKVKLANSGETALKIAQAEPPDLILLDVMMPGMNGYETCSRLKSDPTLKQIPVIFLTAMGEVEDEEKGFALGAVDYVVKPLTPSLLLARVKTHLTLKQIQNCLEERNAYLETEIARRIQEINQLQEVAINAMASLAETRDRETGAHILRTAYFVKELALHLRQKSIYSDTLTLENIFLMTKSAPLHDIGKMGIPEMILWKPGKLTKEEFEVMKTHASIGKRAIVGAEKLLGTSVSFLRFAKEMAYTHHERWDGKGYPEGLSGEMIPISGRLMALADVYDALISRRVYKDPIPHDIAAAMIEAEAGKQFDPVVIAAFAELAERFREISITYSDEFPEVGAG